MSSYKALNTPLTIRGLCLRNRLFSSAHVPGYAVDGKPTERYVAYHVEKAKGGIGLTVFGGSSNIARDSGSLFSAIYVGDDSIIPCFQRLADSVHEHGSAIMCQITHLGRHCRWDSADWAPMIGPSAVRDPGGGRSIPREMTLGDIHRVIKDYAAAARRCEAGGLDGIEVISSMHLPGQFLSPLANRRSDVYGGELENRARFLCEVLEACRDVVSDDFIIGVRFTADESNEHGLGAEEGVEIGRILGAHGGSDFLNVNGAYSGTTQGVNLAFPGMEANSAPYVELARRVKQASGLPVMQASRIDTLSSANFAIEQGYLDMAGMTRPHFADPHIMTKLQGGEEDRIRPCVGAGYCLDRPYRGLDALCIHNPSTGRENTLPHKITKGQTVKKVLVVGGGPAGLEAARVSAERGHSVTLYEASNRLGGQINIAAMAGWRKSLLGIVDWLVAELECLGVMVHLNQYVDADEVLGQSPDVIILANGGVPILDLPEGGTEFAMSPWDFLGLQKKLPGGQVLYYDQTGAEGALSSAQYLAERGVELTFVTPDKAPGLDVGSQNIPVFMKSLLNHGVTFKSDTQLLGLKQHGDSLVVKCRSRYTQAIHEMQVDAVVLDQGIEADNELFSLLAHDAINKGQINLQAFIDAQPQPATMKANGYSVFRIGDALMSRNIHAAILDARRLCMNLG